MKCFYNLKKNLFSLLFWKALIESQILIYLGLLMYIFGYFRIHL